MDTNDREQTIIRHPMFEGIWVHADANLSPEFKDAKCAEIGGDIWFYPNTDDNGVREESYLHISTIESNPNVQTANMLTGICRQCPMLKDCFNYAVHHEDHGFWGGTTRSQRKALRATHRITLSEPFDSDDADSMILYVRNLLEKLEDESDGDI